jgi:sulfite exporter TauE/SafE
MFAIVAASTGDPWWGAAVMIAFWLGSVPVLAVLGISVQTLASTLGKRIPLAVSLVILLLGLYTIGGRLTIPAAAFETPAQIESQTSTLQQVESISESTPPCCSENKH